MNILHCLLHYVDFNLSSNAQQVNSDLLRVIAKYIDVINPFALTGIPLTMLSVNSGRSLEGSP